MSLDLEAIRRRVEWLNSNAEACELNPGQVTLSGYLAAAIDCGKDVPALLAEVERLRRELANAKGAHREDMRAARDELREAQDRPWHNDRIGW